MAWFAELVFFITYFVAWVVNEIPHSTWVTISAFAALVIAILLLVDNRGLLDRRPAA